MDPKLLNDSVYLNVIMHHKLLFNYYQGCYTIKPILFMGTILPHYTCVPLALSRYAIELSMSSLCMDSSPIVCVPNRIVGMQSVRRLSVGLAV